MSEHSNTADPKPPSVDRLSLLWRRINDHKMVQWSVAYVALAYGIQHGVILTSESFEWPNAVARISMLLLVLGLPLVMTFAWYHGERASRRISGPELSIISILLVIGSLLFYVFVRPSEEASAPAASRQAGVTAARTAAADLHGAISLAVLPFLNLSSDKEQEFFSDGMTEEITAALAKVPDLRVVGRTSAFQFKGENKDLRAIGQALSATHLIEGSVRKAGNRVRITAQLIKADDGTHVWAENYDRELTDVFVVQEEIAQAIAASLQVPLGLKQGESLVSSRTIDLDAYEEFLRARAVFRTRDIDNTVKLLESVVEHDPKFGPAWGIMANAYGFAPYFNSTLRHDPLDQARRTVQGYLEKAEKAARESIRLDPRSASGYAGLALVQLHRSKPADAEDLFKKAVELDPNDPDVLNLYSQMLGITGHLKISLALREKLRALEPFVPIFNIVTAGIMQNNGNNDASIALLEPIPPDAGGFSRNFVLARGYAARGQFDKAADTLLLLKGNLVARRSVEDAARLIRMPKQSEAPETLPVLEGELDFVYAYIGAADRILDFAERQLALGAVTHPAESIWLPVAAPARKTERFKAFVRKAGMVDYWRARGWPDLCHPTTGDDFACN